MELTQHGFLEELLAPRRDTWSSLPSEMSEFFQSGWNFDTFDDNQVLAASNPSLFNRFSTPTEPNFECPLGEASYPFLDGFSVPAEIDTSHTKNDASCFPTQEGYPSMMEDEEMGLFSSTEHHAFEEGNNNCCKVELEQSADVSVLNMSMCGGEKKKAKKLEGQPSKNLMAERRRRKRLNDRLSMLRSIVPKISKMDRTSILSDTIDYMKELLERINKLQAEEEELEVGSNPLNLVNNYKEQKPNEALVRNSPKFDVERRDMDTKIDICCAAKPGLLLSTVNTLEALGLEIQQCVISCFNDFSLQASCSEGPEQRSVIRPEDIKQALFRNAGYGGRCL